MSIMLKQVEIHWAKLDEKNPDMGFDKQSPQWVVDVRTRDKTVSNEWKKLGLNVQVKDDDDGIFYNVKIKKPAIMKNGKESRPVPVVGRDLMPLEDVTKIGNGSIGNVSVHSFEYNFQGREGTGFRLEAIQITELNEFNGKASAAGSANFGFSAVEGAEAATDTSSDEDSLYD